MCQKISNLVKSVSLKHRSKTRIYIHSLNESKPTNLRSIVPWESISQEMHVDIETSLKGLN